MWWQRWGHVADSSSGGSTDVYSTYIRQHAGGGRRSTGRDLRREDEPGQRSDNEDVAQAEEQRQQEEHIEVTRWTIGCAQRGGAARHGVVKGSQSGWQWMAMELRLVCMWIARPPGTTNKFVAGEGRRSVADWTVH